MLKKFIPDASLAAAHALPVAAGLSDNQQAHVSNHIDAHKAYLLSQGNTPEDISKLDRVLQLDKIIIEIGCGNGNLASEIAHKNLDTGVIATDLYDWAPTGGSGSFYQKTALLWKEKRLEAQRNAPDNLVLLRADLTFLRHLPPSIVDTLLLVNPEPNVGQNFMELINDAAVYRVIKSGDKQVIILPFSRELGVACCGGYEFDHSQDWSRGLGFMMASGFNFRKGQPVQWGVDLAKSSPYSRNSTQSDVYVFGCSPQYEETPLNSFRVIEYIKSFIAGLRQFCRVP